MFAVKEGDSEEEESSVIGDPIMDSWELISLNSDGFELRLNFTNPLQVSAGEYPDLLLV